ncbi:MAG: glycosyltransferase family 2 protein [Anaerolineae bacterium]|nr:glycosyltransferase family 2 protein [Anaerolineae bacterium]
MVLAVSVIIPVLNEEDSIAAVLGHIPPQLAAEVLVVDNGCTDNTIPIARSLGARIVVAQERGYGAACYAGTLAAKGNILVYLDGDYSDYPEEIVNLVEPIIADRADLVLGSRLARGDMPRDAMPLQQRLGNWLTAHLMRWLYQMQVTDLGPFRAIRKEALLSLDMQEMTFGWPTEMMVKAARADLRLKEVPVRYRPRLGGKSKISGTLRGTILAGYYILLTTFRYARGRHSLRN